MNIDKFTLFSLIIGTCILNAASYKRGHEKGLQEGYVKGVEDVEASYKLNEMPGTNSNAFVEAPWK